MQRPDHSSFRQRLKALRLPLDRGEFADLLSRAEMSGDALLRRRLDMKLTAAEAEHELCPFHEPDSSAGLSSGTLHVLDTHGGQAVRLRCEPGRDTSFVHFNVLGPSGTGKTSLLTQLAEEASSHCQTFILDGLKAFRKSSAMRASHRFIRLSDLRLNLWDTPDGLDTNLVDYTVNREIARNYSLQFALFEINEAVADLRKKGTPNLPLLIETLSRKRFENFSRRSQYRDSAVVVLQALSSGTGELFRCQQGMGIERLLEGNTVLEVDELLPEHARFVIRYCFEFLHLRSVNSKGGCLMRHMLFILDEAPLLVDREGDFFAKAQRLRHYGVHLAVGFQNASLVPVEVLGNADCIVAFGTQDSRDRQVAAQACNLSRDESEHLATLGVGECVCFLPRSPWKRAFLARVPHIDFSDADDAAIRRQSMETTGAWVWKPLGQVSETAGGDAGNMPLSGRDDGGSMAVAQESDRFEQATAFFLNDVLNQAHEFSSLMQRFERAGIRSAPMQGRILRELAGRGWVRIRSLAIGRGRPVKLLEPTEKVLAERGISWKKGRGDLQARAATEYFGRAMRKRTAWHWDREGRVADKAVDWLGVDEQGAIVSVEIAGSAGHECHNCLHCLRHGVRKHWVICLDKKILQEVRRLFARHEELVEAEKAGRLEMTVLSKALGEDWRP